MPYFGWVPIELGYHWFKPHVGRRDRVLAYLFNIRSYVEPDDTTFVSIAGQPAVVSMIGKPSFEDIVAMIEGDPQLSTLFSNLSILAYAQPSSTVATTIEDLIEHPKSVPLHIALQDLGYQISLDLSQACEAFENPGVYYPGFDNPDPVTDDHVRLVIAALQRELNRERRRGKDAAPLADLPWRIQRAIAERRRLRYAQWGITPQSWQTGRWSVWDVPEDKTWVPPWPHPAATGGMLTTDVTGMVNG